MQVILHFSNVKCDGKSFDSTLHLHFYVINSVTTTDFSYLSKVCEAYIYGFLIVVYIVSNPERYLEMNSTLRRS